MHDEESFFCPSMASLDAMLTVIEALVLDHANDIRKICYWTSELG